jgi:hypothetical protein
VARKVILSARRSHKAPADVEYRRRGRGGKLDSFQQWVHLPSLSQSPGNIGGREGACRE